jgi:hypothetical protein
MSFGGIGTWPTAGQHKLDGRRTRSRSSSTSTSASDHSDASKLSIASSNTSPANTSPESVIDEESCGAPYIYQELHGKLDQVDYRAYAPQREVYDSFSSSSNAIVADDSHDVELDIQAQYGRQRKVPQSPCLNSEELSLSPPHADVSKSYVTLRARGCLNTLLDPKSVCKTHASEALTQVLLSRLRASQQVTSATQRDSANTTLTTHEESTELEVLANKPTYLHDQPHSRPSANCRRTSAPKGWTKPTLERQTARKQDYVMHLVGKCDSKPLPDPLCYSNIQALSKLVNLPNPRMTFTNINVLADATCQLLHFLWPTQVTTYSTRASLADKPRGEALCALPKFLQELLKRCHATYSALTMALYYICLLQTLGKIPSPQDKNNPMHCGRRVFLGALILATKYLQDKSYSMRAWHKVTNIAVKEITCIEKTVLQALDYKMHVPLEHYNNWCAKISAQVEAAASGQTCPWKETLESFDDIKMTNKLPRTSILSTPQDIMSELKSSPAVGAPTLSSAMPYLREHNGSAAPCTTSPVRLATLVHHATASATSCKSAVPVPEIIDLTLSPQLSTSAGSLECVIDLTNSPDLPAGVFNEPQAIDLTSPEVSPSWLVDANYDAFTFDAAYFTNCQSSVGKAMDVVDTHVLPSYSCINASDVNLSFDDFLNLYETTSPPVSLTSADEQSIIYSETIPFESIYQEVHLSAPLQANQYPTPPPSQPSSPVRNLQAASEALNNDSTTSMRLTAGNVIPPAQNYSLSPAWTNSYEDANQLPVQPGLLSSSSNLNMQPLGYQETSWLNTTASCDDSHIAFIGTPQSSDQCSRKRSYRCVSEEEEGFAYNMAINVKRLRAD